MILQSVFCNPPEITEIEIPETQKQIPYGVIIKSPYGDTFQIPLNTYKFWLEILMSNGHSSWSRGLVYA
jgi:hypothetical protein